MKPTAYLITTPLDFKETISGHLHSLNVICQIPSETEPEIRRLLDGIFLELEYIEVGNSGMVSAYLNDIEEPLKNLQEWQYMLFAIKRQVSTKSGNMLLTNYFVINKNSYFRLGDETSNFNIHRFDPNCEKAISDLITASNTSDRIECWLFPQVIRRIFETNAPWCNECCLQEMVDPEYRQEEFDLTLEIFEKFKESDPDEKEV